MERNWDTIRELLLAVDACPRDTVVIPADFESDRGSELLQHVELLLEANLIDADIIKVLSPGVSQFQVFRLRWDGCELLDNIRNDNVWNQTKLFFGNQKIGMTYDAVLSVSRQLNAALM